MVVKYVLLYVVRICNKCMLNCCGYYLLCVVRFCNQYSLLCHGCYVLSGFMEVVSVLIHGGCIRTYQTLFNIYTPCPQKSSQLVFWSISPSNLHQIQKVRTVLKCAHYQLSLIFRCDSLFRSRHVTWSVTYSQC